MAAHWRRSAAGLELEVTVPPNARGRVLVPASSPKAVTEVGKSGARFVAVEGGRVVYDIGSGHFDPVTGSLTATP